MKTATKYFGEIEYEEDDVLTFPKGLYGFEEEQRFLLLPFAGSGGTLLSLQSLATPPLSFVLMDPFALKPDYRPVLQPEELTFLEAGDSADLYYYVTCVVREPVSDSTVNLRCPVAVNERTGRAMQVILDDNSVHMRHPLSEFDPAKGAPSC